MRCATQGEGASSTVGKRRLDSILQPDVAEFLMARLGHDLNALDVSEKLSDWHAEASEDGTVVHITATVEFDVPMAHFRSLVIEAAHRSE